MRLSMIAQVKHWVQPLFNPCVCACVRLRARVGLIAQVKNWVRPLTPEEYDEAVLEHPEECPLAMAGDRRSGRQLIADTPRDLLANSIAALSQTPEGRRRLEAAVVGNFFPPRH